MPRTHLDVSRRNFLMSTGIIGLAATGLWLPGKAMADTPKKGGNFILGLKGGESTDTLDPALNTGNASSYALFAFGDYLLEQGPDGSLLPSLAESWEASDDNKRWHFKIRQGVEFHNGKPLTASDVAKTLQRHSSEKTKSGALGAMRGIQEIREEGDGVTLVLTTPDADLPYLMLDYHLVIQPDGGMENPANGIGTGPYRLVQEEPGVRYRFEKFDRHWNKDVGHFDSHEIVVINDDTARVAAMQAGQVHAIDKVPPRVAKLVGNAPGVKVSVTESPGHYVFVMHTDTPPFDNQNLRLALKYAINRQEMVDKILNGFGEVGNDTPINQSYLYFDNSLPQRAFSIEKAADYYKKSGHDGSPIVLRVSDAAFTGAVDAAQLFQQTANAAGIPLEVKREPADGYWSEVWNKQPFCASYWGGRPTQDQMWSVGYLSTADWNDTHFRNKDFDALLLQARAETDAAKRTELFGKMARIVWEEGGLINPMFNQFIDGYADTVAGWVSYPGHAMLRGYIAKLTWFA